MIRAILLLTVCVGLSGCAAASLTTSGSLDAVDRVSAVQFAFDPALPKSIKITASAQYGARATITESDKVRAQKETANLVRIIRDGFLKRFPAMAAENGLSVVTGNNPPARLKVSVSSLSMECVNSGCVPIVNLVGELSHPGEAAAFWSFRSTVRPPTVYSSVSDDIFDSFASLLLYHMKMDRVIAKQ